MTKKIKLILAREYRKKSTLSEELMWKVLRNRKFHNLKFRRQYIIEGFILDFYCPELQLAIEIDGGFHKNQQNEDKRRQTIIEQKDISFYRILSDDVEHDIVTVLQRLSDAVEQMHK